MNRTQCKMARAALGWSVDDLAREAGLSRRTILRFEGGESVAPDTVETLRARLVREGIAFENGGKRAGVSYLRRD
jgi:transcriptional regulator with XRE-family HTH domain